MATSVESVGGNGGGLVVTELSHIKELVRQLEAHLGGSHDLCKHLTTQIFSITERSISIITSSSVDAGARKRDAACYLASPTPTPTSDVTDGPFKNAKKRKVMEKRKHQVRVTSASAAGGAAENPVDDGHSWRKYGQKEILGAKNPRGYYRCTHRHSQGCLATKQVQRTDEDPTLFDVIYHGEHTCVQRPAGAGQPEHNPEANGLLQSLAAGLTVKTDGMPALAAEAQGAWGAATPTPFYLSSSTPASGCLAAAAERSPFSTSENWVVSPATSDSNNNHVAASYLQFEDAEWRGHNELQEVVSALVAASAPPPPPPPAVDGLDELLDLDIASFFA